VERILKTRRKTSRGSKEKRAGLSDAILIRPDARGWCLSRQNGRSVPAEQQHVDSLGEAVPLLGGGTNVILALPSHEVILERLTLPSKDRGELEGMVRLQIEKTLPFPSEEITCDYEVVREEETESVVVAAAVHTPKLDSLCEPLREGGRLPSRVSAFAAHVAATCPAGTALTVYREQDSLMVAICENGKPVMLHEAETARDPQAFEFELAQMLMGAGMAGLPTEFDSVRIDPACPEVRPVLVAMFPALVEDLNLGTVPARAGADLVPPAWEHEARRARRAENLRKRLISAGILYLVLLLVAIGYVIYLKQAAKRIERKLAAARPQLDQLQAQEARWNAMAPAVDPARSTVEILHQVLQALPEGVTVTQFDHSPDHFMVEGEAGSASLAIQFAENLRKKEALSAFSIQSGPPTILGNDRAQFKIFGKL
jgi:hypothetical protein